MNCKHSKCGKCGGIKLKGAYIGRINLKDICSPKCQAASKDSCECKCRGEFHKGSNSKRMDKLLNPEKYIEKVKNSSLKDRLKKFQPETPTDFLAMFLFNTRIKTSSFDRNADRNLRKDGKKLTLTWLSSKGVPLDVLANDFINEIGLNLDEDQIIEMIVDFIIDYPSGVKTYIDEVEAERIRIDKYYKEVEIPEENLFWEDFTPINGINMATKFKKGSAAAKAFMAKLRAAKGKSKPKLKVPAKLKLHTLGAVKKAAPKKKAPAKSYHKDTKSHNVNVRVVSGIGDAMRQNLNYGGVYDTALQLYLVKFANLSFSLWAVTSEGLRKALKHPEGRNQTPIVYRVKNWGIPKFEKMKVSELKEFK